MSKKVSRPKLDPNVVALKQKYEIDYIVAKYKKLGYLVTKENIRTAVKEVGRSRRKVYLYLNGIASKIVVIYQPKKK